MRSVGGLIIAVGLLAFVLAGAPAGQTTTSTTSSAVTYSWQTASPAWNGTPSGTQIPLSDDGYSDEIQFGFDFPLYSSVYAGAYISANGIISFGSGVTTPPSDCPPLGIDVPAVVPLGRDLSPGKVYHSTSSTPPDRWFEVQHHGMTAYGGTGPELTFRTRLHESGDVEIDYLSIGVEGIYLLVGLRGSDAAEYFQYRCGPSGNPVAGGMSLRFIRATESTITPTASTTGTPSSTTTPTATPTGTPSPTGTATGSPSPNASATASVTPAASLTPSPTPMSTPTPPPGPYLPVILRPS